MIILPEKISGLILAGGRGRRAEGKDKGLLYWQGRSMLERQLNWFSSQVEQVMISANRNLEHYRSFGLPVISDASDDFPGPLAGIASALELCSTDWLFVQPVDMPLMPDDVINQLCGRIKTKRKAYFLRTPERCHYLSLLISAEVLPELTEYLEQGNRRARDFLSAIDAEPVDLGLSEKCFTNLNDFSDFHH